MSIWAKLPYRSSEPILPLIFWQQGCRISRKPRLPMSLRQPRSTHPSPLPRPFSVTLLAIVVLTIAGINLLRFAQAILQREFLSEFPTISLPYLLLSGLVWAASGLVSAWGLWLHKKWAPRFTIIYVLVYSLYYWLERIWLSRFNSWVNIPFAIGANILLLLITGWVLTRPKARAFFGEFHER